MSTAAAPLPAPALLFVSFGRLFAIVGLALGLGVVSGIFLLTLFPAFHRLFSVLFLRSGTTANLGVPIAIGIVVLTPLAIGYAARRLPRDGRGAIWFAVIVLATLVVNLVIVAWFPAVQDGFLGLTMVSLRLLALALLTVLALGVAAWRWLRPFTPRGAVKFGLLTAALLTANIGAIAHSPRLLEDVLRLPWPALRSAHDHTTLVDVMTVAGLFAITPLVLFGVAVWRRWTSWRWIGGAYLALAPVFAYLATDDPVIRRPVTMEEIAPAFPGAEASYAVLMRYGRNQSLGRNFRSPQVMWQNLKPDESVDPAKREEWLKWLTHHRPAIEQSWAEIAPVRAWWGDLNAFDRLGDLMPADPAAETVAFGPPRTYSQLGCAIAGLHALDGRADAAVDTVLPILQVARKLQPSSRSLTRLMIAVVIERSAIETANFILDRGAISPAARARLAAAVSAPGGGAAGARRIIAAEYAYILGFAADRPLGDLLILPDQKAPPWQRPVLNAISSFVYNPRATFNRYGDYVAATQEHMAHRRFDQIDSELTRHMGRPRFKNFVGALLFAESAPAYQKVTETFWKVQDARAALLERLPKG